MRIGIMQPYLFPYLGYFQLIHQVDRYVILDDVQYIKGGWINRNRVLLNGKPTLFTFAVSYAPYNFNINERLFASSFRQDRNKLLNIISQSYTKAPNFKEAFSLIENILDYDNKNVASFITNSLRLLCKYMKIDTPFIISSKLDRDRSLKRENMVIDIVKLLGGTNYTNAIGGQALYSKDYFSQNGIDLKFIKMKEVSYSQFGGTFVPNLSIIDVLMFNNKKTVANLLNDYVLL